MINPLLITRKENAGILRRICSELNAVPREMIGEDWSLAVFLKRDLKTYLYQSHFIFDLSAFKEQGDEFVNLCAGIYYQKSDANIVIYADNCYPGDEILDKLVHNGITNIVANYPDVDEKTNISMMAQDLKECIAEGLSQQKWRRFDKSFDAFAEAREAARIAEKEKEKPRYSQTKLQIAVVGAQGRIGATTFALRLAAYFNSRGGESLDNTISPFVEKFGWADDEVKVVPFPRDPQADKYYHFMKQDSLMWCKGSDYADGVAAWIDCCATTAADPDTAEAATKQYMEKYNWSKENLDFINSLTKLDGTSPITPIFDFKNGLGSDISSNDTSESNVEQLTKYVYLQGDQTYTQLRETNFAPIQARIDDINKEISENS